jgi:tripartite-type tricarboxylate transporter receptor subunit TctC
MIKTMIAIALSAVWLISPANAQSFPSRPVTILVPLAPGGSTGTIGRIIAEGMRPAGERPREKQTTQALAAWQKAEVERWRPIIKAANIKVEWVLT